MRNNRYEISLLYICPFKCLDEVNIIPDLRYPPRLCVVDNLKGKAIDIENRLEYEYIDRVQRLNVNGIGDKISGEKRVAIPALYCLNTTEIFYEQCLKIMNDLESGVRFKNGNSVLDNEEYLKEITRTQKKVKVKTLKKEKNKVFY